MDAVELSPPAAVAVYKVMGSEGFGVRVEEVEARESESDSIVVKPSIDGSSSFIGKRDEICAINASAAASWNRMPDAVLSRHASQLSSPHDEDSPNDLNIGSTNTSHVLVPRPEAKQLPRKSGKVVRSFSGGYKRSRLAQIEVPINETGADKSQMAKQKNNLNGKRGDKRNGKVPKSKCDSFSLKGGLVSFSSGAGGNNILGAYGSKQDIYDATKLVDELSLNELLDGSYKCPSFAKDKGKKAANLDENILHSVRKACSILQLRQSILPQNFVEIDNSYNHSTCLVALGSSVASRSDLDKGDTYTTDLSSCNKDSCSKVKTPANILDFPLYQPKGILERLALPPPKELEFFLLDAAKPAVVSRNNPDQRLGKSVSHRGGLPPFPWSHTSGGHCKSNSDAVKLSTSRNTCQGRWVKIGNPASSLGATPDFLAQLESLTYDHSLVPSLGQKSVPAENVNATSTSVSFASFEQGLSTSATCSIASEVSPDDHSPTLLTAAQTLYDIATHSLKQNPHGMMKWPKKPSQKVMKACKLKSNEKSEIIFAMPKSKMVLDSPVNNANKMLPSKKLRLSANETSDDLSHINTTRTGPIYWSTPRSSRSSPSKSFRDSLAETKHYNANVVKKSCMMPPATRILDKGGNSRLKLRKLMPMDWNRAGGKLD